MARKLKIGLLVAFFCVLLLPLLQQNVLFIDCGRLSGYFTNAPDDTLTVAGLWDGSYQEKQTNYLNDHMGLRPYLIRLNAQIDYSLFQKLDYGGTTLGDNNCLFYSNYIDAYDGRDYAGYDVIYDQMRKLKAVQDTLARLGKTTVLVYCPCKAWFYHEYIPATMRSSLKRPNNYLADLRTGDSLGVRQMDLNKWYMSLKDTSREVLYSKQGIHWSNYGSILGIDTIVRYIEREEHVQMIHPRWKTAVHTTEARDPDGDMSAILNLFFYPKTDMLCYPDLYYPADSATIKPRAIFVGDSYNINFIATGTIQHVFGYWQFWYGFKSVIDSTNARSERLVPMESYDWKNQLNKADCIIILNTPMNANNLGGGFIQAAYAYYYPGRK